MQTPTKEAARIGIVTVSDRASSGIYQDISGPAIESWLTQRLISPHVFLRSLIKDEFELIRDRLIDMADREDCDLILTTGGTGPSPRDVTPEACEAIAERIFPGFGEAMRMASLQQVPTAILSRQMALTRGKCLIINLPGKPAAIDVCLQAVFAGVPYCLDLLGARRIETDAKIFASFRPTAG